MSTPQWDVYNILQTSTLLYMRRSSSTANKFSVMSTETSTLLYILRVMLRIRTHNYVHRTYLYVTKSTGTDEINSFTSCIKESTVTFGSCCSYRSATMNTLLPVAYPPSGKDRDIDANAALTWHEEWRPCLLCLGNYLMQQAVVEPAGNMALLQHGQASSHTFLHWHNMVA